MERGQDEGVIDDGRVYVEFFELCMDGSGVNAIVVAADVEGADSMWSLQRGHRLVTGDRD